MQNDNLNVDDTIGVDDTSPGKMLDRGTLPTGASCTAPVTIGAKFTTNVGWRAADIVILIGTVLALMPTYAYFNGNDTIQDWR